MDKGKFFMSDKFFLGELLFPMGLMSLVIIWLDEIDISTIIFLGFISIFGLGLMVSDTLKRLGNKNERTT